MLWNASTIKGFSIRAADGPIGTVSDLMFDDADWAIRWLVVDTGDWLPGRKVVLPVSVLRQPDPELHHFSVNLTVRQVKESPDINTIESSSRQPGARIPEYCDLPYSRECPPFGGQDSGLPARNALDRQQSSPTGKSNSGGAIQQRTDGRVRSIAGITGGTIEAQDGDIGHAEDFLIDTALWQVRYLTVHTSHWWPGEKVLISPRSVDWIDWARSIIHLDVTRQKVKGSPPDIAGDTADGAFGALFHSYYGIRLERR